MQLVVFGLSHRTLPIERLERFVMPPDRILAALQRARGERIVREAMILSTCNRTEIYSAAYDVERAQRYALETLSEADGASSLTPDSGYLYHDRETVQHLLRVSAGLDSMVLGEMQILGQVKEAYGLAVEGGSAGLLLHRLLAAALRVGKRTRTETAMGTGAVSIASAAVQLANKVFGDLAGRKILIVGAGQTGQLAAKHFTEQAPSEMLVVNRSPERAQQVAALVGGEAVLFEEMENALEAVDVAVCATASPEPLIDAPMVRRAMRDRERRPLVLIDISLPRNIDPAAGRLENVFLHSMESLRSIIDQSLLRRRREIPAVETIVEEETDRFFRWLRSLEVTPLIRDLRDRFEAIRAEEARKHLSRLPAPARETAEAMSRALINRLLHRPTVGIKKLDPQDDRDLPALDAVRLLFDLDGDGKAE